MTKISAGGIQWVAASILWMVLLGAGPAPARGDSPALRHHLTVTLDPAEHRLQAVDEVELSTAGLSEITFDLAAHLIVQTVEINAAKSDFTFRDGRLRIMLTPTRCRTDLRITYGGRFNDPVPEAPLNTDNPGFGVEATIQPRGSMLLAGAGWYPQAHNLNSIWTLTVDAPEGQVAVTTGKSLGRTTRNGRTRSQWAVENPREGIPLVVGPYIVSERQFGRVTAATYFTRPLQNLSDAYLAAVGKYLQLYQGLFGPYAFDRFAVVENFLPTGYGFASFTLMGRRVLQLPFIIHTSLGHEIAHCWWGNGVRVDPSQGNWCEGLTTYVADYLYKERQGHGQEQRLQWLRDYANLVNPRDDFPLSRFTSRTDPLTRTVGYDKGAMVFHMLRRIVGDDNFWQSLRDLYARYRFKAITWSDIQKTFEARSGKSLQNFFRQWVFRPGAPVLTLTDVTAKPASGGFAVQGLLSQQPPVYQLNLDLAVETDKGTVSQTMALDGEHQPFIISVQDRPRRLTVDPRVDIFRRLDPGEIPPTINTLRGAASVSIIVARDQGSRGRQTAERLRTALGLAQAAILEEGDLSKAPPPQGDLLLIGLPADRRWLPKNDRTFKPEQKTFVLNGQSFEDTANSFFGVFRNPRSPGRTVALFLPSDSTMAATLSAKIPHYGKYSYLVFHAGRNQVKGTWPADRSPLTVAWNDIRLFDPATGETFSGDRAVARLAASRFVLVGEHHDDAAHHRTQLAVIRALDRSGRKVAVGLEMFRKESQAELNRWISGVLTEDRFKSIYLDNWNLDWALYRPIFDYARRNKLPMVGLNVARAITTQVANSGFESLTAEQKGSLKGITCNVTDAYRDFIRQAHGAHGHGRMAFDRFCEAQLVWDTAMAMNAIDYIDHHPDTTLVILAGSGHARKPGIPAQIAKRTASRCLVLLPETPGIFDADSITAQDADYLISID